MNVLLPTLKKHKFKNTGENVDLTYNVNLAVRVLLSQSLGDKFHGSDNCCLIWTFNP